MFPYVPFAGPRSMSTSTMWSGLGEHRRHAIGVAGWCEECGGHFIIEFMQSKGWTNVALHDLEWVAATDD